MAAGAPTRRLLPVGPLLLIALGVLLLLNNLGLVSWEVWRTVIRFWPVALILLGLQALVAGRVDWGSLILLLIVFAVISVASWLVIPTQRPLAAPLPVADTLSQELQGARRASVEVSFGGGQLDIGALDQEGLLAQGSLAGRPGSRLISEYRVRGDLGTLAVRSKRDAPISLPFLDDERGAPGRLILNLSRSVPLDLEVQAGGAQANLDLRNLTISTLRYETGATQSTVTLPASGATRAQVEAGAASLTIVVPPGVAARIDPGQSGLSRVQVDESRFPRNGAVYESPDFATAQNRVDLSLRAGASTVEVR